MGTTRNLIKSSLRAIGVIGVNEEPSAADAQVALEALQSILDSMSVDIRNSYGIQRALLPITPGQAEYTMGPATDNLGTALNPDWAMERPVRIEKAVFITPVTTTGTGTGTGTLPTYTHALSFTVASGMALNVGVQTGFDTYQTTGVATFNTLVHPDELNGVIAQMQNTLPFYDTGYASFAACLPGTVTDNLVSQETNVPHVLSTDNGGNAAQAYNTIYLFPVPAPGAFSPYLEVYDMVFVTGVYGAPYSFKVKVFESETQFSIYTISNSGKDGYVPPGDFPID